MIDDERLSKLRILIRRLRKKPDGKFDLFDYIVCLMKAGLSEEEALDHIEYCYVKDTGSINGILFQERVVYDVYKNYKLDRRNCIDKHTPKEWEAKKTQYGYRCCYCGAKAKLTKDHLIPIARGGTNRIDNIVPACWACNFKKLARPVESFQEGITLKLL